jgi:hypothetical protein
MKTRTAIVAACVAALGLACLATDRSASARTRHVKHHRPAKAAIHVYRTKTKGVTTSTGDVNGDGVDDLVTDSGSTRKSLKKGGAAR